jgi:hypothetical protein
MGLGSNECSKADEPTTVGEELRARPGAAYAAEAKPPEAAPGV